MNLVKLCLGQRVVCLVFFGFFISGCSSSGDSGSSEPQSLLGAEIVEQGSEAANNETNDNIVSAEDELVSDDTEISVDEISNQTDPMSDVLVMVPDLMLQTRTEVNFEITVPVYQSNELQVRLIWGDIEASAGWVGDELWSLSLDFPSDTEQVLEIIFSDGNGDINLARYQQLYRTGFNDAEFLQISADQFNTELDSDGDGVSNLNELLAGDDPLFEVRDSLTTADESMVSTIKRNSELFETRVPVDRPFFVDEEEIDPVPEYWGNSRWDQRRQLTINIDAEGNGTYRSFSRYQHAFGDYTSYTTDGARTRSDNTIQWSGSNESYNANAGCYLIRLRFDTRTFTTDEGLITQEGNQWHSSSCSSSSTEMPIVTYSLTGVEVEGSQFCEATAGTIERQKVFSGTTTISKAPEDSHWHVYHENIDEVFVYEYLIESIDLEYFCQHDDY